MGRIISALKNGVTAVRRAAAACVAFALACVLGALQYVWRNLLNGVLYFTQDEYSGSFQEQSQSHQSLVAGKFFRRGQQFILISLALLLFTGGVICIGVATFLFPTTFTDVGKNVESRIDANVSRIRTMLDEQQTVIDRQRLASEYYAALCPFIELKGDLNAPLTKPAAIAAYQRTSALNHLLSVIGAINSRADDYLLNFEDNQAVYIRTQASGAWKISKPTLERLRLVLSGKYGSMELATKEFAALDVLPADPALRLELVKGAHMRLAWIEGESKAAEAARLTATQAMRDFESQTTKQQKAIQDLVAENAALVAEKIVSGKSTPYEQWLPVFLVRFGSVVLFLFLARILVETYRYTMALAAFYRARGDAIQLMGQGTPQTPIDPQLFAQLLVALAPETYRIDKVESPETVLLKLLPPSLPSVTRNAGGG
jgi:hypothetical protein